MWFLWLRRIIKAFTKHVRQRSTCFVEYDRRPFKNCFQQRLIFYLTPVNVITIFLRSGRYIVTKGNSVSLPFLLLGLSADCL